MLQKEDLVAKIGVDKAENEPSKVCRYKTYHSPQQSFIPLCSLPWAAGALYANVEAEWVCFFRARTPFIAENFAHFLDANDVPPDAPLAVAPLTLAGALRDTSPLCVSRQALQRLAHALVSRFASSDTLHGEQPQPAAVATSKRRHDERHKSPTIKKTI